MKAFSLFGVFAITKIVALNSLSTLPTWVDTIGLFWQDALAALIFGAFDWALRRRPWISWVAYWLIVSYCAVTSPLLYLFHSPLTVPMLRAAGGTLSDSMQHYITVRTMGLMLMAAAFGAILPLLVRRLPRQAVWVASIVGIAVAATGGFAGARLYPGGEHRNAVAALIMSAIPSIEPNSEVDDWRRSPWSRKAGESLEGYRGQATNRNVVLILLESTGSRYLRSYGAKEDPMPNLSRFAAESIQFDNAYAAYPESIKGLFSVLCSQWPAPETRPEDYARIETPSIANRLRQEGYRTGLFHSGRFAYLGMESIIQERGFEVLEDAGAIGGNWESSFGVAEEATVSHMLDWVDELPTGQPFFLTYLPVAGHHPYQTARPGPFPEDEERTQYLNALHEADAALGQLWEQLRARSLLSNTVFVVAGDHSEAFGQHPGNFGHTFFVYEENVQVPLFIFAPGLIQDRTRIDRVASLIDLGPTILDLLGHTAPQEYQGTSLLEPGAMMALFCTDYSSKLLGLRDGDWKFIDDLTTGRTQLVHLQTDPGEKNDLGTAHPDKVTFYRARLRTWAAAQKGLVLAD